MAKKRFFCTWTYLDYRRTIIGCARENKFIFACTVLLNEPHVERRLFLHADLLREPHTKIPTLSPSLSLLLTLNFPIFLFSRLSSLLSISFSSLPTSLLSISFSPRSLVSSPPESRRGRRERTWTAAAAWLDPAGGGRPSLPREPAPPPSLPSLPGSGEEGVAIVAPRKHGLGAPPPHEIRLLLLIPPGSGGGGAVACSRRAQGVAGAEAVDSRSKKATEAADEGGRCVLSRQR